MKIGIGSKNKTKVNAVKELLKMYPIFDDAEIIGIEVEIDKFGHPKSLEETIDGAIYRAKKAYIGNDYGFGLESGLMSVPHTKSGYMEVLICAIYDGKDIHMGMSQGCEWPKKVIEGILKFNLDGSQAMKFASLTSQEKIGENEGMIGMMTKGRTNRTELNKSAVMMALIHLENKEHYTK